MKFRKKPIVIDAVKFDGSIESITKMALELNIPIEKYVFSLGKYGTIIVPTLEGNMITMVGDWIIKGVKGEYYPCKPDIFAMTYSEVEVEDIDAKVIDGGYYTEKQVSNMGIMGDNFREYLYGDDAFVQGKGYLKKYVDMYLTHIH